MKRVFILMLLLGISPIVNACDCGLQPMSEIAKNGQRYVFLAVKTEHLGYDLKVRLVKSYLGELPEEEFVIKGGDSSCCCMVAGNLFNVGDTLAFNLPCNYEMLECESPYAWLKNGELFGHFDGLDGQENLTVYLGQNGNEVVFRNLQKWSLPQFEDFTLTGGFEACITTNVGEIAARSVQVFPNPASETLSIKSERIIVSAELIDSNGRLTELALSGSKLLYDINLPELSEGLYFMKFFYADGSSSVERIVLK